jgi:hypothetical protein
MVTGFVESNNSVSAMSRDAQTSTTYADEFKFRVLSITVRGLTEVTTHKEIYHSPCKHNLLVCSGSNGNMASLEFVFTILGRIKLKTCTADIVVTNRYGIKPGSK